jgi:hypothetical protein
MTQASIVMTAQAAGLFERSRVGLIAPPSGNHHTFDYCA